MEKYIFVHVPKTAGTSIRSLLCKKLGPSNISPPFDAKPLSVEQAYQLDSYSMIFGHISYSDIKKFFPDRKLITFLREPVARCLSIYGFFRQQTEHPLIPLDQIKSENNPYEATSLARQLDVDSFFMSNHPHVLQNVQNRIVWQLGATVQYSSRDNENNVLQSAKNFINDIDFVGFYEDFDCDTDRLQKYLSFSCATHIPRLNFTRSPIRSHDISESTRKLICDLNELDICLYDYAISHLKKNLRGGC